MKVLKDKHLGHPLNMRPGDTLELAYTPPYADKETVLLRETLAEAIKVDYIAAFQLDKGELRKLGLARAIGGLFGGKTA